MNLKGCCKMTIDEESEIITSKYEKLKINGKAESITWQMIGWYESDVREGRVNYEDLGRYFEELIKEYNK